MMGDAGLTRREAIAGAAAASVLLSAGAPAAEVAGVAMATGRVFEDAAGAASAAPGERGVAGVLVSNGRDVVRTDAQGRYAIAVAAGQSVFVIQPSGFRCPVDAATGLPRFAHVHAPDGSPAGLRYRGLGPTGALPASIDFALVRAEQPPRFDVLMFTDPQPETLAELDYVRRDVVEHAAATVGGSVAFGITTGDLMFDDLSFYGRYNRILGGTGLAWRSVPGNHDIDIEAPDDTHSRDTWKRVFGTRHHAFQHGGVTFVMLDNVRYLGPDPAKPGQLGKYRGEVGEEQLAFVRNLLAEVPRDSLVVFCLHIPLRTAVGSEPNTATVDARAFLAAISTHPNSLSLSGHTHTNEHHYLTEADGFAGGTHHHHVMGAASGSWWSGPFDARGIPLAVAIDGSPNGYHVLSVDGASYSTRLVAAHDPEPAPLRLMLDSQLHGGRPEVLGEYAVGRLLTGPIDAGAVAATRLVVNLYDGGPRSTVTLAVNGGETLAMAQVARTDPFVEETYARNVATKKPWVSPVRSTHIWELGLPESLGAGVHRLEVRASDEYGRAAAAVMMLEVVGEG